MAMLLLLGACAHGVGSAPGGASAQVGRPLSLEAQDRAGHSVNVAADRGKVRVIDFWATWCEPCRVSMPALDRMASELGPQGLAVYAVSFDEDETQLDAFLAQAPVAFPVLFDRGGEKLATQFDVKRLPTTLIVDRRGNIRHVYEGWTADRSREERRLVEQLLAEPE